jgi:hypothetical protein
VYNSNVLLHRLLRANKRVVGGGTQIEVPQLFSRFSTGGAYSGAEVLPTAAHDTVKNLFFNWKQYAVTWSIDGLTLIKTDSADSIASILQLQSQQAYMEMGEVLANGLFGDGVTTGAGVKEFDGIRGAVGNATGSAPNYGGVSRSANVWHNSQVTSTAVTLSFNGMRTQLIGPATFGGFHPSLIVSDQTQYNRHWLLHTSTSGYSNQSVRQPGGSDELLASAGFTNLLFDNIPHVVDSHSPAGHMFALSEQVLQLVVSPRGDFYLDDFAKPVNQDAMVAKLLYAGNLVSQSSRLHAAYTNITA